MHGEGLRFPIPNNSVASPFLWQLHLCMQARRRFNIGLYLLLGCHYWRRNSKLDARWNCDHKLLHFWRETQGNVRLGFYFRRDRNGFLSEVGKILAEGVTVPQLPIGF